MHENRQTPDDQELNHLMARYSAGHNDAGDMLCASLEPDLRRVVVGFLGPNDPECDDLLQDGLMALLHYLRQGGSLPESPFSFASTILRNRCRNLYRWRKVRPVAGMDEIEHWYAADDHSPLDLLLAGELLTGLQVALDGLEAVCAQLLRSLYLQHQTMEQMRHQLGLTSVQAVYYRRNQCLDQIKKIFKKTGFGSPEQRKDRDNQ